jgi:fatty-acid peroxygenase
MRPIPRDSNFMAAAALMLDRYGFISKRARALSEDVFEVGVPFQRVICMTGSDACSIFYDANLFVRSGAAPGRIQKTLFGKGGVQSLDDGRHRDRKAMFLSLLQPDSVAQLLAGIESSWQRTIADWPSKSTITLYPEVQKLLCEAVCRWAGVELSPGELEKRTRELTALFDKAGAVGPRHWWSRLARKQADRWAAGVIRRIRRSRSNDRSIAAGIARYEEDGRQLSAKVAGVELLNILRPTIAISVYWAFVAHALHQHPSVRQRIAGGDSDILESFVQEVRRFYPFFPATGARVRKDFQWHGYLFPRGRRVMLDLYGIDHDARVWESPDVFDPARFVGRSIGNCALVPQGGGRPESGHRCAGEGLTIEVMKTAARLMTSIGYDVPKQDLRIQRSRLPALPRSGFVMSNVRI